MALTTGLWLAALATLQFPHASGPLTVDGRLDEAIWRQARVLPFPDGSETRVLVRGDRLCVGARLIEPDRVVAYSTGRDPAFGREDLVTWRFSFRPKTGPSRTVVVTVNPLGGIQAEKGVTAAAAVGAKEWTVEASIPIESLAGTGFLAIERVRAPRPQAPELRWQWPAIHERADFEFTPAALAAIPGRVWREEERKRLSIPAMVERQIQTRMAQQAASERREWEKVRTRQDWERFRDPRLAALSASLAPFPERTPLRAVVTRRADPGDGFVIENLVYESRPHLLVTANLYLPAKVSGRIPAVVMVHSHHAPKTQSELQDIGMTWARLGVAVLVPDQLGAGERLQSNPWPREGYYSRYALGMQLHLAGESLMKWMVWDLMRGIDLLVERPYIDPARIVIIGAVAGGGDPAAVVAALDSRVAAVVPFNFGEAGPEEHYTEGPRPYDFETARPGWGSWETTRNLWRSAAGQFFPWFICASVAPRRFVYSFEVAWPKGVERQPAWARYKQVFDLYGRRDRLDQVDGFGPFPGPGECTNVGTYLRKRLYPILKRWLDIPVPAEEYHNTRPEAELMCLTPAVAAGRAPKPASEIALDIARGKRRDPARLPAKLGDIEPDRRVEPQRLWSREIDGMAVEGLVLDTEPGIQVPLLLLKPARAGGRLPVVIGFAQQGKERFLAERGAELKALLEAGVAVCLPDVRGTGETARGNDRGPGAMSLAATELMLGNTMLGARIKDARAVFAYIARRPDIDATRISLWGDSFAPANPENIVPYESFGRALGPRAPQQAEPLGALLALFTALHEGGVRAVAARGGLTSFVSVLEDRFCYVPLDVIVPGILEAADIPDVVAALAPRPVLVENSVDGRNRPAQPASDSAAAWLIRQTK
jgi:dienelactone hydrolase